jgi:hypothetical protein
VTFPPNPHRNIDDSLKTSLFNGGDPTEGSTLYNTVPLDGNALTCEQCHTLPFGTNGQLTSGNALQESQSMKIPQLRNMHEKTGFDATSQSNNRGFGFTHDGAVDTLFEFLQFSGFNFDGGATGDQQRRDIEAFLFSFSVDTHAGVGVQATMGGSGPDQSALRGEILAIANTGAVGMVAKGQVDGEARGYTYLGGDQFQSDRAAEQVSTGDLDAAAGAGATITFTLVPLGSETRIGIDRDGDGFLDTDEVDACSDPADESSTPLTEECPPDCLADITGPKGESDGNVDALDYLLVIAEWGTPCGGTCAADITGPAEVPDGNVDALDFLLLIAQWGSPGNCPSP